MPAHSPVVLVTGCSAGGLGFHLCNLLFSSANACMLILASRCEAFALRECTVYATARSLEKTNGMRPSIKRLAMDVTDDASVRAAVESIVRNEGRIDIIVNNAGVQCVAPLLDLPLAELQDTFDANAFGALRVVQAAVPHMASRRTGLVVTIGSVSAIMYVTRSISSLLSTDDHSAARPLGQAPIARARPRCTLSRIPLTWSSARSVCTLCLLRSGPSARTWPRTAPPLHYPRPCSTRPSMRMCSRVSRARRRVGRWRRLRRPPGLRTRACDPARRGTYRLRRTRCYSGC
jgi:NAD(P)-dependent dehydrogenase (short-subunit alcohol dehydrogenase family)